MAIAAAEKWTSRAGSLLTSHAPPSTGEPRSPHESTHADAQGKTEIGDWGVPASSPAAPSLQADCCSSSPGVDPPPCASPTLPRHRPSRLRRTARHPRRLAGECRSPSTRSARTRRGTSSSSRSVARCPARSRRRSTTRPLQSKPAHSRNPPKTINIDRRRLDFGGRPASVGLERKGSFKLMGGLVGGGVAAGAVGGLLIGLPLSFSPGCSFESHGGWLAPRRMVRRRRCPRAWL